MKREKTHENCKYWHPLTWWCQLNKDRKFPPEDACDKWEWDEMDD